MNKTLLSCLVLVLACLVIDTEAQWWGGGRWGGLGGYYRPYYGWGGYYRPYYGGWGWRGYRNIESVGEEVRAECTYYGAESVLSCKGPKTVVECEVVANFTVFPEKYDYFGMAFCPKINYETTDIKWQVFNMYPRTTEWLNNKMKIGEITYGLGLYYTPIEGLYGFRFTDIECFKDMGRLFISSTWSDKISVSLGESLYSNITIFGDVNVVL